MRSNVHDMLPQVLQLLDSSKTLKSKYIVNEMKKNLWYSKGYDIVKNSFLVRVIFKYI